MSPIRKKTSSLPVLQIAIAIVMFLAVGIVVAIVIAPDKPLPPPSTKMEMGKEPPTEKRPPLQPQQHDVAQGELSPAGVVEIAAMPVEVAATPAQEYSFSVKGRVIDDRTSKPIADARVLIFKVSDVPASGFAMDSRKAKPVASGRTDENGQYTVEVTQPGDFQAEAIAKTYTVASANVGALNEQRPTAQVDLSLSQGATIAGRVTEEGSSTPISGLMVTTNIARHSATTDEQGEYVITGLAVAEYDVKVDLTNTSFKSGKTLPFQKVKVSRTDEEVRGINFSVDPAGVVWGYVITPESQPVTGAQVTLCTSESMLSQALNSMVNKAPPLSGHSEGDGYYELVGVPLNQEWRLYATDQKFSPQLADPFVLTGSERSARIDVYLFNGTTVTGKVVDSKGKPVAGADVMCMPSYSHLVAPMESAHAFRDGHADENGNFSVTEVPAGDYQILARKQGFKVAMVGEAIYPDGYNSIDGLRLVLDAVDSGDHAVFGRVTDTSGAPMSGASVALQGTGNSLSGIERSESTDGKGEFRFDGVEAGSYGITVTSDGYAPRKVGRVALDKATNVILDAAALVRGRVLVEETNAAPPQYTVAAFPLSDSTGGVNVMRFLSDRITKDFSNPDGSFELYIPAGDYRLQATSSGLTPGQEMISLKPGQTLEDVELKLSQEGGVVAGTVQTGDSGNPQGAQVFLVPASSAAEAMIVMAAGEEAGVRQTTVGADGAFEFTQLTAGTYVIIVQHSSYANGESDLLSLEEDGRVDNVVVRLGNGGALEGYVFKQRRPQANIMVMVLGSGTTSSATTDAQGYYYIDGLATGQYQAMVMGASAGGIPGNPFDAEGVPVDIVDGQTTRHDFGTDTGTRIEGTCNPPPAPGLFSGAIVMRPPGMSTTPIGGTVSFDALQGGYVRPIDGSGAFTLTDVPPGDWQLDVYYLEPGNFFELRYVHAELIQVTGEEEVMPVDMMIQGF